LGVDAAEGDNRNIRESYNSVAIHGERDDGETNRGNLFLLPKRPKTSYALLDDPAYEIDFGDSRFDDLSGKWEERKEKYDALLRKDDCVKYARY
jgi:hypothetical protein